MHAMVASADQLATQAGMTVLAAGGNAVDAALATNAAIAMTGPHLCGLGGDLLALVHHGWQVHSLLAIGRAGAGTDAAALRAEGHTEMPFRHDVRTVTVPGCVDGWVALHRALRPLPAAVLLAPAIDLAGDGFPASPLLVGSLARVDAAGRAQPAELAGQATRAGEPVRRPGVAAALRAIVAGGRDGFYLGEFGAGLPRLGDGWFSPTTSPRAPLHWVQPLPRHGLRRGPVDHATDVAGLPGDRRGASWPTSSTCRTTRTTTAGRTCSSRRPPPPATTASSACTRAPTAPRFVRDCRPAVRWSTRSGRRRAGPLRRPATPPTCARPTRHCGVSLDPVERLRLRLVARRAEHADQPPRPRTRLPPGGRSSGRAGGRPPPAAHADAGPGHRRRPLTAVFGSMGGDAQPQIVLQLAARLFHHDQSPAEAVHAGVGRCADRSPASSPLT